MRTFFPLLASAVLLAAAGCGQSTSPLEASYRAAAQDLRKRVNIALQDDVNQASLLRETHEAEQAYENASQLADERDGRTHPTTTYLSGRVVLDDVSNSPVGLTRDDGDPAIRYRATVVLAFTTEGQTDSTNVVIPVTADPAGKWKFPDAAEVLRLTKEQFSYSASALLERAKY